MMGSAVTALVFVAFLILGTYATNLSKPDSPDVEGRSINEEFFADLNYLTSSSDKGEAEIQVPSEEVRQYRNAPDSFLKSLRREQENFIKPSSIFSEVPKVPALPSSPLTPTYAPQTEIPDIPSQVEPDEEKEEAKESETEAQDTKHQNSREPSVEAKTVDPEKEYGEVFDVFDELEKLLNEGFPEIE